MLALLKLCVQITFKALSASVLHVAGSGSISTQIGKDNVRRLRSQMYEFSAAARNVVQSSIWWHQQQSSWSPAGRAPSWWGKGASWSEVAFLPGAGSVSSSQDGNGCSLLYVNWAWLFSWHAPVAALHLGYVHTPWLDDTAARGARLTQSRYLWSSNSVINLLLAMLYSAAFNANILLVFSLSPSA